MDKLAVAIAGEITLSNDPGGSMKKWREIFGITQTELAEFLGVTPSTISDYEGSRRKSPGAGIISRFVNALIAIDEERGGRIVRQLRQEFEPQEDAFEVHEFFSAVGAEKFARRIDASCLACKSLLKDQAIYGYTIIDSFKMILSVPVHEYMHIYGRTPNRALIFTKVQNGRSPMIAVKIGRFSTDMKPSMVVIHGPKNAESVDRLAVKIAESEKIPLLLTTMPIEKISEVLKEFES
jgi:putative transcriptional regulator